ncbi:muscleblind-like protein 1 isoform X10 [Acanthaster planci]|uniref:Muscleblind-like protein 1 isoform X10 n=1 Tax=Acanthaster planci TaxID=133434 RepID=A0A8B7YPA8_ACAPL|nr:muscleblind-like protein 1 isoform X10 [Acanthaster planci]
MLHVSGSGIVYSIGVWLCLCPLAALFLREVLEGTCNCKMSGIPSLSSRMAYNFLCPDVASNFQGRCTREDCKYLHPPPHLKTQLEINGKNSIAAQKMLQNFHNQQLQLQAAAASMQLHQPGATILPTHQALNSLPTANQVPSQLNSMYSPYLTAAPTMAPASHMQDFPTPGQILTPNGTVIPYLPQRPKNDKLEVCREFQRGNCSRAECKFAHPAEGAAIDQLDNTVTVCMDYIKGRCSRDKCKYFHPPAHLQTKIKAAQHNNNQASVVLPTTPETISKKRAREPADDIILNPALPGLIPPPKKGVGAISHLATQSVIQHHPTMYQPGLPSSMQMNGQPSHYLPPPKVSVNWHYQGSGSWVALPAQTWQKATPEVPMMPTVPPGAAATMPSFYTHQVMAQQQSADTIPVCRDFKSGSCKRPNCRYAHVTEDYVEIIDGKVTLCRYAAQSRCTRPKCKFYHPPTSAALAVVAAPVSIPALPAPVVTSI